MRGLWIAGAMLIACSALANSSPSPDQVQRQKKSQSADEKERTLQNTPIVIDVNNGGATSVKPNEGQKEANQATVESTKWTAGLLLVAVCQAGLFWWQLSLLKRQIKDAIRADRPYMFMHGTVKWSDQQGTIRYATKHADVRGFDLINLGNTPAFVTSIKYNVDCFPAKPSAHDIPDSEKRMMPGNVACARGQRWPTGWQVPIEITQEMIEKEDFDNGIYIYLYGEITYVDAFCVGDSRFFKKLSHYNTVFCQIFDGTNFVSGLLNDRRQNDYT